MDMLAKAYEDDSNTPKLDRNREDSVERLPEEPQMRMDSRQLGSAADKAMKSSAKILRTARDTDSDSSASDDESASEGEPDNTGTAARRSSLSSENSSHFSTSLSGSDRSDAKEKEPVSTGKDRRPSSSSKVMVLFIAGPIAVNS